MKLSFQSYFGGQYFKTFCKKHSFHMAKGMVITFVAIYAVNKTFKIKTSTNSSEMKNHWK